MAADLTVFNDMLKEYYAGPKPELLAYKDHPLLALLRKKTDWGGQANKYIIPLWVERPQAVANHFTTALNNKGSGTYERFEMGRKKKYGFAQLDRLAMLASMKNPKAFLKLYTTEVNGVMGQLGADIAWSLYRGASGVRARVASRTETVVTLANRADVVGFSVGMNVVFSDGGGDPGVGYAWGGAFTAYTIDAIDRSAGTLTFAGDTLATDGLAANDWIHREGDIVTQNDFIGIEGLDSHIPETAPTSGTFQSVDWTTDTDRLAGLRVDGSSLTIEESLIDAGMRLKEMGKRPTHVFMNPVRGGQLIKELGAKVQHDKVKAPGKASLGFDAIKVYTPAGTLPVIFDADCPQDVIWVLDLKTWVLASTGPVPHIFDDDVRMLRDSALDEYEVRMGAYLNLGCHDPGANLRIDLD